MLIIHTLEKLNGTITKSLRPTSLHNKTLPVKEGRMDRRREGRMDRGREEGRVGEERRIGRRKNHRQSRH